MTPQTEALLREMAKEKDFEAAGIIPSDPSVSALNGVGKSLLNLPDDSSSMNSARQIALNLDLMRAQRTPTEVS